MYHQEWYSGYRPIRITSINMMAHRLRLAVSCSTLVSAKLPVAARSRACGLQTRCGFASAVDGHEFLQHKDWKQAFVAFQRFSEDFGNRHARSLASIDNAINKPVVELFEIHALVKLCSDQGQYREASDVLRRASQQLGVHASLASHALVCCALARKGHADRALETMKALYASHRSEFSANSYDTLLSIFKIQNDWKSVHAVIQQLHDWKIEPPARAFRILMLTAAKAKRKDVLTKTVMFVRSLQFHHGHRDIATLTATCQALMQIGDAKQVLAIYREIDAQWLQQHGNALLFNNFVLAAVYDEKARMGQAMDIVEFMKHSAKAAPDDFTYATCMHAFAKRSQWDKVLDLFNEMQQKELRAAATGESSASKSVLNALTCVAVLNAVHFVDAPLSEVKTQLKNRHERRSLNPSSKHDLNVILKKLPTVELTNIAHASNLIDTLDTFGLFPHARRVFDRMQTNGILSDSWLRRDGFEIDLHTFSRGVAKCAVVHAFETLKSSEAKRSAGYTKEQDDELRIITGVGKRSKEYMQPVIRQEIQTLLSRAFNPAIWPAVHRTNPGVLLVRRSALRKWLAKDGSIRWYPYTIKLGKKSVDHSEQ